MTVYSFTDHHDPDDVACRELTGKIELLGMLCLIAMEKMYPQFISGDRLAYRYKAKDKRKTLDPILADLWTYGYASKVGEDNWRITDKGRTVVHLLIASQAIPLAAAASTAALLSAAQPALSMTDQIVDNSPPFVDKNGDFLRHADRSSSDLQIDQSVLDRSSIDPEEEKRREKIAWLDQHSVTGDKRKLALAAACTAADLESCLAYWTREGQTALGEAFRSKKYGPLNYAISCAINGDIPPAIDPGEATSFPSQTPNDSVGASSGGNPSANPVTEKISEPSADSFEDILEQSRREKAAARLAYENRSPEQKRRDMIWQAAQGELQLQMTHATYHTWVKPTSPIDSNGDHLVIAVPNQYTKDWWDQRLMTTVTRILSGIVGRPITVEFVVHKS